MGISVSKCIYVSDTYERFKERMVSHTDKLKTPPTTKKYREGWDRIWKKEKEIKKNAS